MWICRGQWVMGLLRLPSNGVTCEIKNVRCFECALMQGLRKVVAKIHRTPFSCEM